METALKIEKSNISNDDTEFRGYIGALLFLSRFSRPDISYPVNKLSQHQGRVTNQVKKYARRIIQYLYDTRNLAIEYRSADAQAFRSFADASFAPDIEYTNETFVKEINCYSVSGFAIYHHGNLFNWNTSKQNIMATSSTAAEVISVCDNLD